MAIRSFRQNYRSRGAIDPGVWNSFWDNLWYDLNDVIGTGEEPISQLTLGVPDFLEDYDIAISGMAGKEIT